MNAISEYVRLNNNAKRGGAKLDLVFFLGVCALIVTAVVSICQVYRYNEQRKTAELRMDDLRRQLDSVEHRANVRVMQAEAEWRVKLKDEKRDFEKKSRDAEFKRIAQVRQLEKDLKDREKLISSLQTQMTKLSNDAAIVIMNLRQAKPKRYAISTPKQAQLAVVDKTCEKCQGRGKHKEKTQCPTCDGKGFHTVTGTKLRKEWNGSNWYMTYDRKTDCEFCSGRGFVVKFKACDGCNGHGRIPLGEKK